MVLVGGGVPAAGAARLRLPMLPMNTDQVVRDAYVDEGEKVGYRGLVVETVGPTFVHVAEDPEKRVGRDRSVRAVRSADVRVVPNARPTLDAGREGRVGRRPQGVAAVRRRNARAGARRLEQVPPDGSVTLSPLAGGLPPDLAWASLELFAAQVMPHLQSPGRAQASA